MVLNDNIQKTLRDLNKITKQEIVKKEGDLYIAINVLTGNSRIMQNEEMLIEALIGKISNKQILKG
tara:strand:+ start:72 stop:269 length:198 start_codon:yes stop_codon:yes gene_type:complete